MRLIDDILYHILPEYLSYKYILIVSISNKNNYNKSLLHDLHHRIYFTPKTYQQIEEAVDLWCIDK